MSTDIETVGVPPAPSAKTLAVASGIAFLSAALILAVAVLPAEYGIDPFGMGKKLGFLALSQAGRQEPVPPPTGTELAPVQEGNVALYPGEYKVDSRVFVLGPYEYVEFKYHLAKDARGNDFRFKEPFGC